MKAPLSRSIWHFDENVSIEFDRAIFSVKALSLLLHATQAAPQSERRESNLMRFIQSDFALSPCHLILTESMEH